MEPIKMNCESMAMSNDLTGFEIAIVGMAGRFPGACDVESFWRNLCRGEETITFFAEDELRESGVPDELLRHPDYVRAGAVLEDIAAFDAEFFGMSPQEAELTDPQHRLLLECAEAALQHAGYDPERFAGLVGIYAGSSFSRYLFNLYSDPEILAAVGSLRVMMGNDKDYLATRIAYKLGLEGPAVTVQTACSTALVAVHLACEGLLSGDCEMALAGSSVVKVPHRVGYLYRQGEIFSPDGHCRPFDRRASGTLFGSGVGLVVLKRLDDALAQGDTIHAVIKGSAINNDGSRKVGYTAPSAEGQGRVIRAAQTMAQVDPGTIGFVETHGTATPMGDPIEFNALKRAFHGVRKNACALGAVKSNVGHLDTAAGIAGLIKTVLVLRERKIPPNLHFESPLPELALADSPFYIPTELRSWEQNGGSPRRAGVSSFGIGGTNAHVVLEEAPPCEQLGEPRSTSLLVVSARTAAALAAATLNLTDFLEQRPETRLADAAYTLQVGRRQFAHRLFAVSDTARVAAEALKSRDPRRVRSAVPAAQDPPVLFMFPGQGGQHVGMAAELHRCEPVFQQNLDHCCQVLREPLGFDLLEVLHPPEARARQAEEQLRQTLMTQTALFAVEYSLARLWMEWGIRPRAVIGHSLGEFVAACVAGVMRLEDALALVALRGRLMQRLPRGSMLVISRSRQEVEAELVEPLALAAVNGPRQCVVSGPTAAVEALARRLRASDVECRELRTSHAFHSGMMEPVVEAFGRAVEGVSLRPPEIPLLSNLTGTWVAPDHITKPSYWARQLRETVRFGDGLQRFLDESHGGGVLLEIGPGRALSAAARQQMNARSGFSSLQSLPPGSHGEGEPAFLLTTLGRLWLAGVTVDWPRFQAGRGVRRIPLPTYPFERRTFWIRRRQTATAMTTGQPLRSRSDLSGWFHVPAWRRSALRPPPATADREPPWLVLDDPLGLGRSLRELLEARRHRVVTVSPGERFERLNATRFTVDPRRPEDFAALFDELEATGRLPGRVVHMWALSSPESEDEWGPEPEAILPLAFDSLIGLAQALGSRQLDGELALAVISNGVYDVTGGEPLTPAKAVVLGPIRVIPLEYPNVTCRHLDVELPNDGDLGTAAAQILEELLFGATETCIAFRHRQRWQLDLESVQLPAIPEQGSATEGGTYLITGGLGGVGFTLAEHLARRAPARLVLVQRTPIPQPPHSREQVQPDEVILRDRRRKALETAGAEVLTITADVTRPDDVRRAVAEARRRFGRIDGVLHAAGLPGGGLIQLKTPEAAWRIMAPKLAGTRLLARELADEPPDFFLLCSSTLAISGAVGQVDYCAANSFLDAFAAWQTRAGRPTVSVNWDGWENLGMTARRPPTALALDHPWLIRRSDSAEGTIFEADLDPRRHWLLDEHRWLGRPLMPGTGYLELMAAALADTLAVQAFELADVSFLSPLTIDDGMSQTVRVLLERSAESTGSETFTLKVLDAPADSVPRIYAIAHGTKRSAEPRRHDLGELESRLRPVPLTERNAAGQTLSWGPRWQCLRSVRIGDGEALGEVELAAEHEAEAGSFHLHPALLDVATSFSLPHLASGAHVPISYGRLRVNGRLPGRFLSHARRRARGAEDGLVVLDLVLVDPEGHEVIAIEGYTARHLGEVSGAGDARPAVSSDVRDDLASRHVKDPRRPSVSGGGIRPAEGTEAMRRILGHRVSPQVIVTPRDVQHLTARASRLSHSAGAGAGEDVATSGALRHDRPQLEIPFVAPKTDTERRLAEIWQKLLGIGGIGIHDNFFELGGDSMIGVQILARATQAGLALTTGQLFQYPTIAEQARVADESAARHAEAIAPATDDAPFAVTPFQRRLLERGRGHPRHVVRYATIELEPGRRAPAVRRGLVALARRHEALRLRFHRTENGWTQKIASAPVLTHVDLSRFDSSRGRALIEASEVGQSGWEAIPIRFTFFASSPRDPCYLRLAAHAAALDAYSWRPLLDELHRVLSADAAGETPSVPSSRVFRRWSRQIRDTLAGGPDPEETARWREMIAAAREPATGEGQHEEEVGEIVVHLEAEATRGFLEEIPRVFRTAPAEALCAALFGVLGRPNPGRLRIEIENSGRGEIWEGVDTTGEIGCFAFSFPVVLETPDPGDPAATIRAVKEQLRRLPLQGLGFALCRELDDELDRRAMAGARLRYLGRVGPDGEGPSGASRELGGIWPPPDAEAPPYDLVAGLAGDRLQIRWRFRRPIGAGEPSTIKPAASLARAYLARLHALIEHCRSRSADGFTPSDFPTANLSQGSLDHILARFDGVREDGSDD